MKIAIIYFNSLYERTGAGKVVRTFLEQEDLYKSNGIDIKIYCPFGEPGNQEKKGKSYSKWIKKAAKVADNTKAGSYLHAIIPFYSYGKSAVEYYFDNSDQSEDLILFHELRSCYAYINYCKKNSIKEKPFMIVEHTNGEPWKMLLIYYPKIKDSRYEKKLLSISDECEKKAKRIILVSNASRDIFCRRKPEYSGKAVNIPNGIEDTDYVKKTYDYSSLNIITVGTVNSRKNQIMLIECLHKLNNENIDLTVVGDGDKLDECKRLCVKYKLHNVSFLGARDDVPELLIKNNIFVLPSFDEGLPISAIEAMRAGLPLILTDVGGNGELIDRNGWLVNPNVDEICIALKQALQDTESTSQKGIESRNLYIDKYCVDAMVSMYSNLFREVLGEN